MHRNSFKSLIKSIISELVQNEEELDEATTTGDVEGYNTPFAFSGGEKEDKEKRNRYSTNSTGYKIVKELVKEILGETK
tara:strand:+ start:938 stop:1174 length:237 start_codon:yes stop_codon:yes gene_type:complete